MTAPTHPAEPQSNRERETAAAVEPRGLRTYTPSQAVLARSAGLYHWTAEGRRLYDFTSGVLVANLGHNPRSWLERFLRYMGWSDLASGTGGRPGAPASEEDYCEAVALTAYNAVTPLE